MHEDGEWFVYVHLLTICFGTGIHIIVPFSKSFDIIFMFSLILLSTAFLDIFIYIYWLLCVNVLLYLLLVT